MRNTFFHVFKRLYQTCISANYAKNLQACWCNWGSGVAQASGNEVRAALTALGLQISPAQQSKHRSKPMWASFLKRFLQCLRRQNLHSNTLQWNKTTDLKDNLEVLCILLVAPWNCMRSPWLVLSHVSVPLENVAKNFLIASTGSLMSIWNHVEWLYFSDLPVFCMRKLRSADSLRWTEYRKLMMGCRKVVKMSSSYWHPGLKEESISSRRQRRVLRTPSLSDLLRTECHKLDISE